MANNKLKINNKKQSLVLFLILLSAFLLLLSASLVKAAPLKLQVPFPCPDFPGAPCPTAAKEKAGESPAAYIARLYQFALMLSGMLAFGMIIFGAIQYTVSAGNTAQQSDARDRITQALWGVALLLGAYLILYTIDPKLVSLKDPDIGLLEVKAPPKTRAIGQEGDFCKETADCSSGYACQNGKCALSEERKQAQESGKHQWVDFGSYAGRANLCPKEMPYADNYCSGPKPGDSYRCCLK